MTCEIIGIAFYQKCFVTVKMHRIFFIDWGPVPNPPEAQEASWPPHRLQLQMGLSPLQHTLWLLTWAVSMSQCSVEIEGPCYDSQTTRRSRLKAPFYSHKCHASSLCDGINVVSAEQPFRSASKPSILDANGSKQVS